MLSAEEMRQLAELIGDQHDKRSACVDAMSWVQRRHGWVSDEHLCQLAELLDMSPTELDSVATFYTLIFRKPVGRHVILVCDSISCWICGCETVLAQLNKTLGIEPGQTTPDGAFTLLPVPCLGACHRAPTMMVDDELHQNLTAEKIDAILQRTLEAEG